MKPSMGVASLFYCYAALLPRRGPYIASHSVCPSVRLSVRPVSGCRAYFVYSCTVLRANIQNRKTSVFAYGPASRMYFSARAEGRISYGHLGRTNSCLHCANRGSGLSGSLKKITGLWDQLTTDELKYSLKFQILTAVSVVHLVD